MQNSTMTNKEITQESYQSTAQQFALNVADLAPVESIKKFIHLLLPNGYFYLALKKGSGEILEHDSRYDGDFKKFWSYYDEEELINILQENQFKILESDTVLKNHPYQTHSAIRIFCQKI